MILTASRDVHLIFIPSCISIDSRCLQFPILWKQAVAHLSDARLQTSKCSRLVSIISSSRDCKASQLKILNVLTVDDNPFFRKKMKHLQLPILSSWRNLRLSNPRGSVSNFPQLCIHSFIMLRTFSCCCNPSSSSSPSSNKEINRGHEVIIKSRSPGRRCSHPTTSFHNIMSSLQQRRVNVWSPVSPWKNQLGRHVKLWIFSTVMKVSELNVDLPFSN